MQQPAFKIDVPILMAIAGQRVHFATLVQAEKDP